MSSYFTDITMCSSDDVIRIYTCDPDMIATLNANPLMDKTDEGEWLDNNGSVWRRWAEYETAKGNIEFHDSYA